MSLCHSNGIHQNLLHVCTIVHTCTLLLAWESLEGGYLRWSHEPSSSRDSNNTCSCFILWKLEFPVSFLFHQSPWRICITYTPHLLRVTKINLKSNTNLSQEAARVIARSWGIIEVGYMVTRQSKVYYIVYSKSFAESLILFFIKLFSLMNSSKEQWRLLEEWSVTVHYQVKELFHTTMTLVSEAFAL